MFRRSYYAHLLFYFICLIILAGCTPNFYAPNMQNVPLMDEALEANATFGLQRGLHSRGLNLQAAFSPFNHVGLMFNYQGLWSNYQDQENNFWTGQSIEEEGETKGNLLGIGLGFYLPVKNEFVFEIYTGMGWGNQKFKSNGFLNYNATLRAELSDKRYFLQPAFGWLINEHFELGFSNRFYLLNYHSLTMKVGDELTLDELTAFKNNPSIFIEPAVTMRVGGENIKFQYQVCYSYLYDSPGAYYDPLAISFSVIFQIKRGKND